MLSNITDWSSRLAAQAAQAAKKGTADALQLAARKLGDISESLHDVDLSADEQYELCQLIDGDGACQDLSLHHFFEMLGVSKQTPYMIISIMGSQSGGKSTLLNHMVSARPLHTVAISIQTLLYVVPAGRLDVSCNSRLISRSTSHNTLSCLAVWDQIQGDGSESITVWPKYSWHVDWQEPEAKRHHRLCD